MKPGDPSTRPPQWPLSLLHLFCPADLYETIEGDLVEQFREEVENVGRDKARRIFLWNVVRFLRPGIFMRNRYSCELNFLPMIQSYFRIAIRQIRKNKALTLIKVLSLVLAISSSLLIAQYVEYEMSFDTFLKKRERIFRFQEDRLREGVMINRWAAVVGQIGPSVKQDFPEVEEFVQVFPFTIASPTPVVSFGDRFFNEHRAFFATDRFFKIFSVKVLTGNESTGLSRINTIMVSRAIAKKYFGEEEAVGKMLTVDRSQEFEVTGVFEDFPVNSHFHPDLLFSMETLYKAMDHHLTWNNGGFHTYILLREGTDVKKFESKLPAFIQRRAGEDLKPWNEAIVLHLQRVDHIHLDSHFIWEYEENGDRNTTYFIAIIGAIILIIALINYINLSIAKSAERAKEVSIRKVVGGWRSQLIYQFIFESSVTNFISLCLSLIFFVTCSSSFITWLGISIPVNPLLSISFWIELSIIASVSILISSLYPAFSLSQQNIVSTFKGKSFGRQGGSNFFRTLSVIQFSTSITLMIVTYCVYAQIDFMRNRDNGFIKEQILVLRAPNEYDSLFENNIKGFKNEMLGYSDVGYVVCSSDIPGQVPTFRAGGVRNISGGKENAFDCTAPFIDYNYVEMLGLKILAGRGFSEELMDSYKKVLINEEAMKKLDIAAPRQAIGQKITFWRDTFEIVGVVRNYYHESLRKSILPMVFRLSPTVIGYISVRVNSGNVTETIARTEQVWKKYFQGFPFDYFFLDDNFNNQFRNDQRFGKTTIIFSSAAIFIACIGLVGLSMVSLSRRVKEIGIRKILGASVSNIVVLLNRNFAALISMSILIAIPAGGIIVENWLRGFVGRIELTAWFFVVPSALTILASMIATSFQTIRAANANPASSLKNE
jgi:putative ABC transport system permease protein